MGTNGYLINGYQVSHSAYCRRDVLFPLFRSASVTRSARAVTAGSERRAAAASVWVPCIMGTVSWVPRIMGTVYHHLTFSAAHRLAAQRARV